jgi:hypothetical protein
LRRKPSALLNLTYRDKLFPRDAHRRTWEALTAAEPARIACRIMVGLLELAHERTCEAELARVLDEMLDERRLPDLVALRQRFAPSASTIPAISVVLPGPMAYDALLNHAADWHSAEWVRA